MKVFDREFWKYSIWLEEDLSELKILPYIIFLVSTRADNIPVITITIGFLFWCFSIIYCETSDISYEVYSNDFFR